MIHYDHMSLQETIKSGIKDAMKAKDSVRLTVLRGLSTAFMNELVATNRTPQSELSDDETLAVISREAKKRKDSINQFTNGGRLDLVDIEEAELNILNEFLPIPMSHAEILPIIHAKIALLNAFVSLIFLNDLFIFEIVDFKSFTSGLLTVSVKNKVAIFCFSCITEKASFNCPVIFLTLRHEHIGQNLFLQKLAPANFFLFSFVSSCL